MLHDGARDLVGLVAEGQVDLAITPLTHRPSKAVQCEPLLARPLVVFCPIGQTTKAALRIGECLAKGWS